MYKWKNGKYIKMTEEEINQSKNHNEENMLLSEPKSEIELIQEQITDLQLALTELYEGGVVDNG